MLVDRGDLQKRVEAAGRTDPVCRHSSTYTEKKGASTHHHIVEESNLVFLAMYGSLPLSTRTLLEANAFEQLQQHLQKNSEHVGNMQLMTLSGFCRNCLGKWLMLSARDYISANESSGRPEIAQLKSMEYSDFLQRIYGIEYKEWKKMYNGKPTEEEMAAYKASAWLHAKHDDGIGGNQKLGELERNQQPVPSNLCCENFSDDFFNKSCSIGGGHFVAGSTVEETTKKVMLSINSSSKLIVKVGIITVSDRASRGEYKNGDESGPAVAAAFEDFISRGECSDVEYDGVILTKIVADDMEQIQSAITSMAKSQCNIILTTGGTGFSKRDVTPEAVTTMEGWVENPTLMQYCLLESAKTNPLAVLCRGVCGVLNTSTFITTLPGRSEGAKEIFEILAPFALAIASNM